MPFTPMFLFATLLAPPPDYAATIAEITDLSERMNSGEPVDAALSNALTALPQHAPRLAADRATLQLRTRAQLQLARAALSAGDHDKAEWLVDEAIRSAMGAEIPIDDFGPSLAELYADRHDALMAGGKADIEIECRKPCRVFVDEHETGPSIDDLPLGVYRLWIEGADGPGTGRKLTDVLVLETNGQVVERVFDPAPSSDGPAQPVPTPKAPKRIMPRSAEAVLLAFGAGLLGAGVLLATIQPNGDQTIAGGTLAGVGGAMLLVGGITLGVDEVRLGKQRGHQAMVTWTIRF